MFATFVFLKAINTEHNEQWFKKTTKAFHMELKEN